MFRFLELELHGWDFWQPLRIPLDADVVILSGPNGAGKTTMLDAIRQILHAPRLSQNRRIVNYMRQPNQPALLRAIVSNRADNRGRRPFERQQVFTDDATLACALIPNGGTPEKRFAVLPGRVAPSDLQKRFLETRDWLSPEAYRRVLEYAGVSRSLMHILAIEQGRADDLSRREPRQLFQWIMEARGTQQVLERYKSARKQYEDSVTELDRQNTQVHRHQVRLTEVERKVRRLDEYIEKKARVKDATDIKSAAPLQLGLAELLDIDKKLPELRATSVALLTTVDRLKREIDAARLALENCRGEREAQAEVERKTISECDEALDACALLLAEVQRRRQARIELDSIPEEDEKQLDAELRSAREEDFRARERHAEHGSALRKIVALISDLEAGIRRYPREVQDTLDGLAQSGIQAGLIAERIEITNPSWTTGIESVLGNLRYAICVDAADEVSATGIARKNRFLGPIVSKAALIADSARSAVLQFTDAVPTWLIEWAGRLDLLDDGAFASGRAGVTQDGTRRDIYGVWVSQAPDRVIGGGAIRYQLEHARQEKERISEELADAEEAARLAATRVSDLDTRLARQRKRDQLLEEVALLPELEDKLVIANELRDSKKRERDTAKERSDKAVRAVFDAEALLDQKNDELTNREKDLEGTRTRVIELERRRTTLEAENEKLKLDLDSRLVRQAEAGELPPLAMAERQLARAQEALAAFEREGDVPVESIREERVVLQRVVASLVEHVQDREREADAARVELGQCRGDYLNVIRSTLHDYSKRARILAEMASAKLEIELPDLNNDDRSLDEAAIIVRIGFDGKPPSELGDTGHSGGQQVIAGLILLMSMAEIEGDSFFIVDEPFAHLSLDRVEDVGRFLHRSGAQFLITVPTTLDRGQLDPASLLVVLTKKSPNEDYAPRPIVARA